MKKLLCAIFIVGLCSSLTFAYGETSGSGATDSNTSGKSAQTQTEKPAGEKHKKAKVHKKQGKQEAKKETVNDKK